MDVRVYSVARCVRYVSTKRTVVVLVVEIHMNGPERYAVYVKKNEQSRDANDNAIEIGIVVRLGSL